MLDDVRGVFVLGVVLEVGVEPVLDARSVARRHIRRVIDATVSAPHRPALADSPSTSTNA
jgi:hypothetical protein